MKIAIVKLSALGDIIQAAFVVQFIKQNFPQSHIDWIVEERFAQVLNDVEGIDNIKTLNLKNIKKNIFSIFKERRKIKNFGKYDLIIDMQGLLKSAIVARFMGKNIAGFDRLSAREGLAALFYRKKFYLPYDMHTIDRYRLLVSSALDITVSKDAVLGKKAYMNANKNVESFKSKNMRAVFIIGATWESRCYPKEHFIELARGLEQNYGADVFIPFGSDKEYNNAKFIEQHCKNVTVLPKLSLNELKSVIAKADLVVGNDTGPTYLGWANNIPTVILFGPTPPVRVYQSDRCTLIKSPSTVNPNKLNKHDYSIAKIEVVEIEKAIASVVKESE